MAIVSGSGAEPTFNSSSDSLQATLANSSDRSAIEHFLCNQLQRLPSVDFEDQLEINDGKLGQRLLLKHDTRIVGHVHLRFREISWGKSRLLTCDFGPIDLLPGYQNRFVLSALLREIEIVVRERRAVIVRANLAELVRKSSSPLWPAHWFASRASAPFEVNPRALLAEIAIRAESASAFQQLEYSKDCKATTIRPFRQMELAALMQIYRLHESTGYGYWKRTEEYWRWIVRRSSGVQIFVAVDHRNNRGIKQRGGKIVAYAVVCGNQVLEILGEPTHVVATEQLLTRICADAIEHNFRSLCVATTDPAHRLAELCVAARAATDQHEKRKQKTDIVGVPILKLLVRRLSPELIRRWRVTQTSDNAILGWGAGKHASQLVVNEKSSRLIDGDAGSDRLICSHQIWMRLLLGELNAPVAFSENLLEATTPHARRLGEILFPQLPVWQAAWDNLINTPTPRQIR